MGAGAGRHKGKVWGQLQRGGQAWGVGAAGSVTAGGVGAVGSLQGGGTEVEQGAWAAAGFWSPPRGVCCLCGAADPTASAPSSLSFGRFSVAGEGSPLKLLTGCCNSPGEK